MKGLEKLSQTVYLDHLASLHIKLSDSVNRILVTYGKLFHFTYGKTLTPPQKFTVTESTYKTYTPFERA